MEDVQRFYKTTTKEKMFKLFQKAFPKLFKIFPEFKEKSRKKIRNYKSIKPQILEHS